MRLTTKIMTGLILSIFLISLLFIIGYSFTDRKNYRRKYPNNTIQIPQAERQTGINVASYRVIALETEQSGTENLYHYFFMDDANGLFIQPATTADAENTLFVPETLYDFISTQTTNDTLTIKINLDALSEKYGFMEAGNSKPVPGILYGASISGVNLYLHTSNVDVINHLNEMHTHISHMETDSIKIYAAGKIHIDSCIAHVIEPLVKPYYLKVTVKNSVAKELILDLDHLNDWDIDNCEIAARKITTSKRYNDITITGDERETIVWQPKNNDVELNLKFKGNAAQITYETQSISD